jgi:hypothetical protein
MAFFIVFSSSLSSEGLLCVGGLGRTGTWDVYPSYLGFFGGDTSNTLGFVS